MVFDADGSCALCALALALVLSTLSNGAAAVAENFPFNDELLLDTKPMRGSKRVPMLDIQPDGAVLIDLWCNSVQGQFVVAADTITVLTGPKTSRSCSPERERGDQEMLSGWNGSPTGGARGTPSSSSVRKSCAFTARPTDVFAQSLMRRLSQGVRFPLA